MTLHEGMTGIAEDAFINTKAKSYSVTADVDVPTGGGEGVIIAQAGRFGGWSLYMKGGRAHECYNFGGLQRTTVSSPAPLSPGRHTITYDFVYDGGKPGSGGMSQLSVDGKKVGEARVEHTMPFFYGEAVDVGRDDETPVTEDYKSWGNEFTGHIEKVTVETK
jgi:arylsulfatase